MLLTRRDYLVGTHQLEDSHRYMLSGARSKKYHAPLQHISNISMTSSGENQIPVMSPAAHSSSEAPVVAELTSLQTTNKADDAVADALENVVANVFHVIGDRVIDSISLDHAVASVSGGISTIFSTIELRYDPGDSSCTEDEPVIADHLDGESENTSHRSGSAAGLTPGSDPEPAPIDRWARGCLTLRSTRERNETADGFLADDGSEGARSIRSMRSVRSSCALPISVNRARVKQQKEDAPPKPFPIEPEVYEDASLASAKQSGHRRANTRGWKVDGGKGEQRRSSSGYGSDRGQGARGEESIEAMENALRDLSGREWTLDGSGELVVVNRPRGDAMAGTMVSASYTFRDVTNRTKDVGEGADKLDERQQAEAEPKGAEEAREMRGSSSRGASRKSTSLSRRASRRKSSRRPPGSPERVDQFFALEPTLQPNLTTSVEKPGPGVLVCDGDSVKEGPLWPQDPKHMSRSEYRQRQRATDTLTAANAPGASRIAGRDEDISSLGFSLGSVQSAPALLGLSLVEGDVASGGQEMGSMAHGDRSPRVGTGGLEKSRGGSLSAFNNVNPLEGGVRVPVRTRVMPSRGSRAGHLGGRDRREEGDEKRGSTRSSGALSPLSISINRDGDKSLLLPGPESTDDEEGEKDDPHIVLVKDPHWGQNVVGTKKRSAILPKIKQVSREKPPTHERPHTRNLREPRYIIPGRTTEPQVVLSPKTNASASSISSSQARRGKSLSGPRDARDRRMSAEGNIPPLPSLSSRGAVHPPGGKLGPGSAVQDKGGGRDGVIIMAKPREILVEGLLR